MPKVSCNNQQFLEDLSNGFGVSALLDFLLCLRPSAIRENLDVIPLLLEERIALFFLPPFLPPFVSLLFLPTAIGSSLAFRKESAAHLDPNGY